MAAAVGSDALDVHAGDVDAEHPQVLEEDEGAGLILKEESLRCFLRGAEGLEEEDEEEEEQVEEEEVEEEEECIRWSSGSGLARFSPTCLSVRALVWCLELAASPGRADELLDGEASGDGAEVDSQLQGEVSDVVFAASEPARVALTEVFASLAILLEVEVEVPAVVVVVVLAAIVAVEGVLVVAVAEQEQEGGVFSAVPASFFDPVDVCSSALFTEGVGSICLAEVLLVWSSPVNPPAAACSSP